MSNHRMQMANFTEPLVAVPIFVAVAIVGAASPRLLGLSPYGQQAIDTQIEQEDGSLCESFGLAPGRKENSDCKAALADLRRRHELLLLH